MKILKKLLRKFFRRLIKTDSIKFSGNYASWDEAEEKCTGYDAPNILEKVKDALLKVKNGEAVYERDSVLFDKIEYSLPLLASLLYVAIASGNKLKILDFGGSLGSSFFQNRGFLDKLNLVEWSIVEQKRFVDCGKEYFQDNILKFYDSIEKCKKDRNPNVVLLSIVLPYLKEPYKVLSELLNNDFEYILIDRQPFFKKDYPDRITIQEVPSQIYEAKIPAWIFNRSHFESFISDKYKIVESFKKNEKWYVDGLLVETMFYLLKRR